MVPLEKKNGNKYFTLASTDKNKKVLEKYTKLWHDIKKLIINQVNMKKIT